MSLDDDDESQCAGKVRFCVEDFSGPLVTSGHELGDPLGAPTTATPVSPV